MKLFKKKTKVMIYDKGNKKPVIAMANRLQDLRIYIRGNLKKLCLLGASLI